MTTIKTANGLATTAQLPEVATRAQVAEFLQISASSLAQWAMVGKGPRMTKIGHHARYLREHVLEYLAESESN